MGLLPALAREEDEAPPALELRLRPNGQYPFPAQISSSRTTVGPGCRPEVRCTLKDIGERRRSEAERDQRMAELLSLNERLQRSQDQLLQAAKLAAIGQLAAGVAHELNNPLSYVKTNVHGRRLSAEALEIIQTTVAAAADAPRPARQ
jgi:phosphoglycerate-specific signal transduction histidine kinase